MASTTITEAKSFLETGDIPTEGQFVKIIDTLKGDYNPLTNYLAADNQTIRHTDNNEYLVTTNTTAGDTPSTEPTKFTRKNHDVKYAALSQTGGSNAFTATVYGDTAYVEGVVYLLKFPSITNNAGNVTVNINSIGAKTLKRRDGNNATIYNLHSSGYYECVYDGTNLVLLEDTAIEVEFRQSLSAGQVQTLFSVPVDITDLPAPGAGYAWEIIGGLYKYTDGATNFDSTDNLYLFTETATLQQCGGDALNNLTANTIHKFRLTDGSGTGIQLVENKKVQIKTTSADSTVGDGTIVVYGKARKVKI